MFLSSQTSRRTTRLTPEEDGDKLKSVGYQISYGECSRNMTSRRDDVYEPENGIRVTTLIFFIFSSLSHLLFSTLLNFYQLCPQHFKLTPPIPLHVGTRRKFLLNTGSTPLQSVVFWKSTDRMSPVGLFFFFNGIRQSRKSEMESTPLGGTNSSVGKVPS